MLKLFCSDTINNSISLLINELKDNYQKDREYIFIAPDRFSLSLERDILDKLDNLSGALNIDVVSFSRFADKEVKDKRRYLSEQASILILAKVIARNQKKLVHYTKSAKFISFAKEMHAVITMLRNCGYTAEDIDNVIPKTSRGTLSKLKDISLITKDYLNELAKGYCDTTSKLEGLIDTIPHSNRLKTAHIYIGGFYRFTAQEISIIKALIQNALSLNISLTPTNNGANADLYPSSVLDMLKGLDKGCVVINKPSQTAQPFYSLNRKVFSADNQTVNDLQNKLVLYKEPNVFDEINGIATTILTLIKTQNLRFKDIAIINCNQNYQDIISTIFEKKNIPFFIDKKYLLSQTVLLKYLFSVLECRAFGYRNDKVLAIVKSPLFPIEINDAVFFENYITKYGINFNAFKRQFDFGEDYEVAENIRRRLVNIVGEGAFNTQSTRVFVEQTRRLISGDEFEENYLKVLSQIESEEMLYNLNIQAKQKLIEVLNDMEEMLCQTDNDYEGHISILKSVVEAVEISLIPKLYDSVFIGNIKDSRLNDIRVLFIMAATADYLPEVKPSGAIISPTDADILADNDLKLYPLAKDIMREEQFLILDLLTKAQMLYIGYSALKPDGTPIGMSSTLKEIMFFTRKDMISLNGQKKQRFPLPKTAEPKLQPQPQLYFKRTNGVFLSSVTQLECYFKCPYLHHLRYGIKLKQKEDGRLKGLDIGRIIHRAMELFFRATLDKLDAVSQNGKLQEYAQYSANKSVEEELKQRAYIDAYTEYLLKNIKTECQRAILTVADNILMGKFRPKYVEAEVGLFKNDFDSLELDVAGHRFKLQGKIDRVDVFSDKAAVIDYKTGGVDVTAADVYYGLKLQLFWYSNVISKNHLDVIGAFYLPIKDSYRQDGVSYTMQGFMVDYDGFLQDFDPELAQIAAKSDKKVDSTHIPVSLKNTKNGVQITKKDNLMSMSDFKGYLEYSQDIICNAIDEIVKGNIEKSPFEDNKCQGCQAYNICLDNIDGKRQSLSGISLGDIDEFHR